MTNSLRYAGNPGRNGRSGNDAETEETRAALTPVHRGKKCRNGSPTWAWSRSMCAKRRRRCATIFRSCPYLDAYVVETPRRKVGASGQGGARQRLCDRAEFRAFHADTVGRTQLCPQTAGGRRLARRERHQASTRWGSRAKASPSVCWTQASMPIIWNCAAKVIDFRYIPLNTAAGACATAVASTSTGMARTWRASSPARISAWRQAWN